MMLLVAYKSGIMPITEACVAGRIEITWHLKLHVSLELLCLQVVAAAGTATLDPTEDWILVVPSTVELD